MSTTNHHVPGSTDSNDSPSPRVVELDGLRRRKRLDHLLATRSHLAVIAAQQRSHRLDDGDETFRLQMAVETTIRDEFPDEHEARFTTWLEQDVDGEHPSGVLTADCGICRSIATAQGLNLVPPEAA